MKRFLLFITFVLLISLACNQSYTTPTATDDRELFATPTSTLAPATQTPEATPTIVTDWLGQLEVITAGNWSRLQLLKTFPAEMPLNHSAVAISPDGKTLAIGGSSGAYIIFIDLAGSLSSTRVDVHGVRNVESYFNRIEYLPDGTLIANSNGPYEIYHIDTAGNVLSMWDSSSFALSMDKKLMAYGTDEGTTLVDIANNTSLGSLEGGYALDYSFSPDGSKIAVDDVGVDYINTMVWDISSRTILTTLDETSSAQFSPDGKFLAVTDRAEDTNPLKIFSPDGQTQITTLNVDDPNGLTGVAPLFSYDGSIIAAQIGNGSPVAWGTANWQTLEMPRLQGNLYSFSPDGRILITRTSDGGIMLWGVLP